MLTLSQNPARPIQIWEIFVNEPKNDLVARKKSLRQMRLRKETELLQESLHGLCNQATGANEGAPKEVQRPIRSIRTPSKCPKNNQLQNQELYNLDSPQAPVLEYSPPVLADQLPQFLERELISLFDDARLGQAERVLEYLARAESRELDPWARDDIHVAWLTILYAARGYETPWGYAFWSYYGKTYAKAIKIWAEQDAANDLVYGPGLTETSVVSPPRKPVQSVREIPEKKAGEK